MAATGFLTKATISSALLVVAVVGESLLTKVNTSSELVSAHCAGDKGAHLGGDD